MQQSSGLEIPIRVIGPDGTTVLWVGVGIMGQVRTVKNTDTVVIGEAQHCAFDSTTGASGTFILPATNPAITLAPFAQSFGVKQGGAAPATSAGFAPAAVPVNGIAEVYSIGSICMAAVSGATGTVGQHVKGAASGLVTSSATVAASPEIALGYVLKPSGTTGLATDTGVATRMGIVVMTHGAVT